MDRDLAWWAHVVFHGWQARSGPRYRRLAAAVLDAIDDGRVEPGTQIPSERLLADALGVSRGTAVACFDQLVEAGVVRRRQGAGTFVVGRPAWIRQGTATPAAGLLLRRLAERESLDLSLSVPASTDHLPAVDPPLLHSLRGHGLDPRGSPELRRRVARHLTDRQQLPTDPDELVITSGAQQALGLVAAVASGATVSVVAGCPTYPGLVSAFAARRSRLVPVAGDGRAGVDPAAVGRAARAAANAVLYVAPTGANPTGAILPAARRSALIEAARANGALLVEDLALADLIFGEPDDVPAPLGALADGVVSIGSLSKLLWAGLRIGWLRAPASLLPSFVAAKAAMDLATSVTSQALAVALLDAIDDQWITDVRSALRLRADRLTDQLRRRVPAWAVPEPPAAGLSLWVGLPVRDADAFADTATRYGVTVANGSAMCLCDRHRGFIRLSLAEPIDVLDLAAERLAVAWEAHSADLAATPAL